MDYKKVIEEGIERERHKREIFEKTIEFKKEDVKTIPKEEYSKVKSVKVKHRHHLRYYVVHYWHEILRKLGLMDSGVNNSTYVDKDLSVISYEEAKKRGK